MKTDNLIIGKALKPFKSALGESFAKVEADIKSALGREEKKGENDPKQGVQLKDGDWKASASFKLVRKNGESLQLPPNAPWAILLCFGMRMNELAKSANSEIESSIPEICQVWVDEHKNKVKPLVPLVVA